jgi:tetratricopeptide (TPR) repeat protein
MKKIVLSMFLAGVASIAFAQKSEVNTIKKAWDIYDAIGKNGPINARMKSLKDILDRTDKAVANEESKIMPNLWAYRALASSNVAINDTANVDVINTNIKIAREALEQVKTLDVKGTEKGKVKDAKANINTAVRNAAIIAYNTKNYDEAYIKFVELTKINPNDTAMYFNAGIVARELKNYPNATKMYKKVISFNHPQSESLYGEMINWTLASVKDTAQALDMVKEASLKYPENTAFIQIETDIYLKKGEIAKSEEMLNKLATKDPKNSIYQALLGKIYLDQAIDVQNGMKNIDIKKKAEYDAAVKKRDGLVNKSLPFFTKAAELDPKNVAALENLKLIYNFKSDTKNYEIVKKKLDALPKN